MLLDVYITKNNFIIQLIVISPTILYFQFNTHFDEDYFELQVLTFRFLYIQL